jgi:ankyrin repeat protein
MEKGQKTDVNANEFGSTTIRLAEMMLRRGRPEKVLRKILYLILAMIACPVWAQAQGTFQFTATLTGANEIPPNSDPTVFTGLFSLTGNSLSFLLNVPAWTFNSVSASINGPALLGGAGPIIFDLGGPFLVGGSSLGSPPYYSFFSPFNGLLGAGPFTLSNPQINDLESGHWYVNVTSETMPAGQLRGQITPVPEPSIWALLCGAGIALWWWRRKMFAKIMSRFAVPFGLVSVCAMSAAAQGSYWKDALKAAIRSNDVAEVGAILSSNSLPPGVTLDDNSVTPLHLASLMGSREVASWLLGKGAPVDATTVEQGHTPLIIAAGRGHLGIAKLLLEHFAGIDHKDSAGLTPLLWAIHQDQPAMAEYLIRQGADINAVASIGRSALMMAAEKGSVPLVTELIAKGANVNHTNEVGNDALIEAAEAGHADVVRVLLQKGGSTNRQNADGWTGLMKAAALGHFDVAKALCEAGAEQSKKNKFGRTAMDYAKGISGTTELKTGEDFDKAVETKVLNSEELYYVMARKRTSIDYGAIVKLLAQYSQRSK